MTTTDTLTRERPTFAKPATTGARPGVKEGRWFAIRVFEMCTFHNEVASIDPRFHACKDCGHSWRDDVPESREIPGVVCATCERLAKRQHTSVPSASVVDVCSACGAWMCGSHTRWTDWASEDDEVCMVCIRKAKKLREDAQATFGGADIAIQFVSIEVRS